MIIQKTDKPLYATYATYWEDNTDGLKYVAYPNPKQKENQKIDILAYATIIALKY